MRSMHPVVLSGLTGLCLAASACTQAPVAGEPPPQPLATETPAFCAWALTAPVSSTGQLTNYFGPNGEDCVPPEGGEIIRVALGLPSSSTIVARTPRTGRVGETLALGGWTSVTVDGDGDCSGWLRVSSDVPDWALEVDATCARGARLAGRFEGHYPAEWR